MDNPTRTLTTWQLARMAGVADPDRADDYGFTSTVDRPQDYTPSAGALFLRHVADAYDEAIDYSPELADGDDEDGERNDRFHELADDAPDVYNHQRWQEFTDLAAWAEVDDTDQIDGLPLSGDMTEQAGQVLYAIALRLLNALHEWRAEQADEDEDGDQ